MSMNSKIGFLLGYCEEIVGCNVYIPTEHQKEFVSDLRIDISISTRTVMNSNEVKRQLQAFDDLMEEGEVDDLTEENRNVSHQLADNDANGKQYVGSNVDMESSVTCDDVDMKSKNFSRGQYQANIRR